MGDSGDERQGEWVSEVCKEQVRQGAWAIELRCLGDDEFSRWVEWPATSRKGKEGGRPAAAHYNGVGEASRRATTCLNIATRAVACPHALRWQTEAVAVGEQADCLLLAMALLMANRAIFFPFFSRFCTETRWSPLTKKCWSTRDLQLLFKDQHQKTNRFWDFEFETRVQWNKVLKNRFCLATLGFNLRATKNQTL
jgi:hypothetical protein